MEAPHQMLRIGEVDVQQRKQQGQITQEVATASPPQSASTSPSHEFAFTVSLHPTIAAKNSDNKSKSSTPQFAAAIDLSPADEIFFHGHLLPLHRPVSPRSSTNSLESFTLPIKELLHDHNIHNTSNKIINGGGDDHERSGHVLEGKGIEKSKSFSFFSKWRKGGKIDDDQQMQKGKSKFELLKMYVRFVKPFISLRNRRQGNSSEFLRQQPYSYAGNLRMGNKRNLTIGRRGEFSAPASMRTSPANSGLLRAMASGASTPTKKSDNTMEELQAAIQAAIAHCKKSIAGEDKIILPL